MLGIKIWYSSAVPPYKYKLPTIGMLTQNPNWEVAAGHIHISTSPFAQIGLLEVSLEFQFLIFTASGAS